MEKHLAFSSIIRKGAAIARRLRRSRKGAAAIPVALALVTLYSTSSAATAAIGRVLRNSPTLQALAATPSLSHTPFAGLIRLAAQAQSDTLNVGRRGHTATRLPNGKVLIVGGENATDPLSVAEIFDPASRTFTLGADAGTARTEHAAVRLNDGRVLITGGRTGSGNLDSTQLFDPSSGLFTEGPSLAHARAGHSSTVLADGRVLIVGGDEEGSAEIFNPQAQSFTMLDEPLYAARSGHSAVLLQNGKVLIVGGNAPLGNPVQSGEIFDPVEASFSPLVGAMSMPRTRPVLRELPGGLVQVIGGSSDSSMEIYVPANDAFQAYAHLPATTPVADVLNSRTRTTLFRNGQPDALLDRGSYTLTEIPQSNLALVAGGAGSGGQILNTISVLNSSAATVTTDKIDYGPGELVAITGTGFQPNETIKLTLHEEQAVHEDRTFTSVADGEGNFTNTDFTPEAHHFGVTFLLTAKGQTSSFVTQTTFTDAATITTRVTTGSVFRLYGQTALSIPVTFCKPTTNGTGVCEGIDGEEIEFFVGGVSVGTVTTSTQTVNGVPTPGRAVLSYEELKNAGGYTLIAKFYGDELYMASQGTASMSIGKVTPTVTWQNPQAPITYGTPLSSTQLSATAKDNTVNSLFTGQAVQGAYNYSRPAGTVMDAGNSQPINLTFVPAEPINYINKTASTTISVTKVPLVVTPNNYIRTYGQPNPEMTGVITGIQNNDPITATFSTVATQTSGAGSYDITATLSDPSLKLKNYNPQTLNKGTLAVNKVMLNVTADDKSRAYGMDNPPFTFGYTGFVLNETASTPGVLSGAPSLTTSATAASTAGAYPITISLGSLAAANYDFNLVPATLTVSKAQSVLNLSGLTQTFDGTPKAVTVTTDPPGLEVVSVSYNGSAQAPTNAGSYAVTATLNNPNYESATVNGTLVVNRATQVINFAPIANHTMGDAPFALDATSSAGLPVSLEVISGNATLAGNVLTINGAGPVAVRASQSGDANYDAATAVVRTFDVSKAAATINIDQASLTQTYNGAGKTVTVTTTPAGLEGLSVSYRQGGVAVPAPTNAGNYDVTATLNNPDYEAADATATLSIGQAEVQVTLQNSTYIFDGLPHPATAMVTGSGGQDFGTLNYKYSARSNVGPDAFEPALPPIPPVEPGQVPPAPSYTVLNDPPATPHNITVFPERDFVTGENYSAADGQVTINVLRRDATGVLVTVGSATATPEDDPTTPEVEGFFEVNHPGGACWVGSTPNIRAGDIVRVTNAAGVADQTTVAYVSAGRPVQVNATTIRISGRAMDAAGIPLPLDQFEQRMISSSNDPFILSGRRDIRAPGNGTLEYDDEEDPTHWTATYTGLTQADIDRAMRVESRILWLGRDPAVGNELTIFEIGDGVFGGPQAPCSAPLEGTSPTQAFPPPPAPSYTTLNDPPVAPHLTVVFPERDFVSIENYAQADGPVTINVLRSVTEPGGATTLRTVGSSVVALTDDPTTPNFDGMAEVNHPGGGCWIGTTPDIQPGDIVRVTTASGVADQTTVANVKAERAVQFSSNTVVIHGTAQDAAGNPLPIDQIEQRMISSSADRFNVNGRRDIRAGGGEVQDGTLEYDAPGSIHWTATYTNLGPQDVARALRSETRILWLGRDPAVENELTIFEIGDGVFGGPQAPCNAPLEGSAAPVWVGTYDVSVSLSGNPNFRIATNTAQINITKATPVVNVEGGPFEYDGQPHPATVVVIGIGENQFVPPDAYAIVTYALDANSAAATTAPPVLSGVYEVEALFEGSKNYNPAKGGHKLVIENAAPVAQDMEVSTDEDQPVTISLRATDANGGALTFSIVSNPEHGTLVLSGKRLCSYHTDAPNESQPSVGIIALEEPRGGSEMVCIQYATYTPAANYNGPDSLTYTANDGQADSNMATVTINVNPVNDAPQVNAGLDKTINEGGTFVSAGSFVDLDNAGTWTATVSYGDGGKVRPLALNPDKTFALSNVYTDSGTYTVTVTVTDEAGASASDTAVVTSINVAPKPVITGAPYQTPEAVPITLGSTVSDPSAADTAAGFRYLWTVTKNNVPFVQSGPEPGTLGMSSYTFTPDVAATYVVKLKVTDKDNGAATTSKPIYAIKVDPSDDFNDNSTDTTRWTVGTGAGMTVVEQGGQLQITPPASATGYPGYFARTNINLTNRRATVEVVQSTPVVNGIETAFMLVDSATGNHLLFDVGGDGFLLQHKVNGVVSRDIIPYDAAQHRFWRLRHDPASDTIFWETSPEGLQWTIQRKVARPFDLSKLQGQLYAGKHTATTPASTAIFDNYRVEDVPTGIRPALTPSDNFDDNSLDASRWKVLSPTYSLITVREQNQRVEMALPPNTESYNGIFSLPQTNFWNKTLSVEIPQATNVGGAWMETSFRLMTNDSNYFHVVINGENTFVLDAMTNGVQDRSGFNYSPSANRFWRFRHNSAAHTMNFESSADGVTWTTLKTVKVNFPIDNMRVFLTAGASGTGNSTPGTAVFDNLLLESNE
jgi:hypothetical protein